MSAAMESNRRPIHRLLLSETLTAKRVSPYRQWAEERGVPVEAVSPAELSSFTGVENHGGVAAVVGPRGYASPQAFVTEVALLPNPALLFALENFHEAHNLGYALRCVEALGADGVLLDARDWGEEETVIAQSSSGAFDRLQIGLLAEPRGLFKRLEAVGVESLLATAGAYRSVYDFNLSAPVLIVVGGEFRGVSDVVRKACRHTAHLPMKDTIPSFPAGHAAALLAAEAARQRQRGGTPGPLWPENRGGFPPHSQDRKKQLRLRRR